MRVIKGRRGEERPRLDVSLCLSIWMKEWQLFTESVGVHEGTRKVNGVKGKTDCKVDRCEKTAWVDMDEVREQIMRNGKRRWTK